MSTQMSGSDAIPNAGKDARYVGNLFIDAARFGFFLSSNCQVGSFCTDEFIVARPVLRDNLVLRSGEHGINVRGAVEVVIDHNSLIDSSLRIDLSNQNADMLASSAVSNTLAVTAKDFGITVIQQDTWSIDYSSSQGTFPGFETSGETSGLGPNNLDVDAMLGSCVHRIPPTSPLSGAGSGGSDIGATIIKRYVDGNLTNEALWDPTTGAFPCGAIVAGINDSGEVCSSVHTRLGISTSCAVE
jgi:hypothetical protein